MKRITTDTDLSASNAKRTKHNLNQGAAAFHRKRIARAMKCGTIHRCPRRFPDRIYRAYVDIENFEQISAIEKCISSIGKALITRPNYCFVGRIYLFPRCELEIGVRLRNGVHISIPSTWKHGLSSFEKKRTMTVLMCWNRYMPNFAAPTILKQCIVRALFSEFSFFRQCSNTQSCMPADLPLSVSDIMRMLDLGQTHKEIQNQLEYLADLGIVYSLPDGRWVAIKNWFL